MKKFKGVAIIIASIILLVILAGMYKFNYLSGQKGYDCDGNKIQNTHNKILWRLFHLNTTNTFYIHVPETEAECKISEWVNTDSVGYAKGHYTDGYEKGTVFVENKNIIVLQQPSKSVKYFAVPFTVSNQGSGLFYYLGTFRVDYMTKKIKQIDTYFLGDRIKINSIKYMGNNKIQVKINIHSENEPMSALPSELKIMEIKVSDGKFSGKHQ